MTGSTGFVGSPLMRHLASDGHELRATLRSGSGSPPPVAAQPVVVGDMSGETDWDGAVKGIDAVVHLAARAHVMRDPAPDPLAAYRRVNVDATLALGRAAASAGVRRFVYISSIKVNGDESSPGLPFRADSPTRPTDPYGISKLEAEQGLHGMCAASGTELVIIRPPLVYGPGVKANFRNLMSLVARGLPLPFGAIDNRRSLVAVDNLADLISRCVTHPLAAGRTFFASDGEDLSTPEIVRRLARAMGLPARLVPVPQGLLVLAGSLVGRSAAVHRLCGSLQVDASEATFTLGWHPPVSVDEGFARVVDDFMRRRG